MEEKYRQYLQYDWNNSEEWKLYFNNIFPVPPSSRVDYYKKKFYKLKIDPDFENGFGQSINNYRYPSHSTVQIIFQGEAYGRGRGDGSADEHGCIVNNYSDLNMQQYKNGLGCAPGYYTI